MNADGNSPVTRIFLAFILLSVVACSNFNSSEGVTESPIAFPSASQDQGQLPEFLQSIWPPPNSTIEKGHFDNSTGIVVAVWRGEVPSLAREGGTPPSDIIHLKIDDLLLPNSDMLLADGLVVSDVYNQEGELIERIHQGPYYFSWEQSLEIGKHEATVEIDGGDRNIYEYSWEFEIVDDNQSN